MIKPQAIRQIESKRFNKEFSTFLDLGSLKQFCKNVGIFNSMSYRQNYREYGFSDHIKAIVHNHYEGELDPGAYLNALWRKASHLGIKILTGMEGKQ